MKLLRLFVPVCLALCINVVAAQQPTTCPAIVERALAELADICGEMDRNTACYGNVLVESSFQGELSPDTFTNPADRARLHELKSIETAPLDLITEQWGIAVLNAQANVPATFPGQGVTFLLLGDAFIDNRVDMEDALLIPEAIEITASTDAVLREQPSRESEVIDIVAVQTTILADATDRDREWLRVRYNNQSAWVLGSEINEINVMAALPIVTPNSEAPMQAFYFSTGIGQPDCNDAPDVITIQGREDFVIDLNVNGADIRIGSTIDFRTLSADRVAMTVREGTLEVVATGQIAVAGETIIARTEADGTIIDWEDPRPASTEEIRIGTAAQLVLASLSPGVDLSTIAGELIHTVVRGDTLFSIGRQYQASLPAIIERNTLDASGTIFVGQRLVIPDPGSGFVGLPGQTGIPSVDTTDPTTGSVPSCTGFTATSPLDGLAFGDNIFYWDAPADATGISTYRVVVVNTRTGRVVTFDTGADTTTLSGDVDQEAVGFGYDFTWQVQALNTDGSVACTTQQVVLQRADVSNPLGPAGLAATWTCVGPPSLDLQISISGAAAGENVLIEFTDSVSGPQVFTLTGPADSLIYPLGSFTVSAGKATADSGAQAIFDPPSIVGCP